MSEVSKQRVVECLDELAKRISAIQAPELVKALIPSLTSNPRKADLGSQEWLSKVPNTNGLYYIEAKFDGLDSKSKKGLNDFGNLWNAEKSIKPIYHRTRCYGGQINALSKREAATTWIPFYLGKARNIQGRIFEHLFHPVNDMTWALRLGNENKATRMISEVRVSWLEFDVADNAYSFMGHLEKEVRKQLHPIMGKQ